MNTVRILVDDCRKALAKLPDNSVDCIVTSTPYYRMREYGPEGNAWEIGWEDTPQLFVASLAAVFADVRRVLKPSGNLFLNIDDTYVGRDGGKARWGGLPEGSLCGIPWRLVFALQEQGWIHREDIIWHKTSPVPFSGGNRCTRSHEYLFHFTLEPRTYFFDAVAIRTPPKPDSVARYARARNSKSRLNGGAVDKHIAWPKQKIRGFRKAQEGLDGKSRDEQMAFAANRRSVWSIASTGSSIKHYATFPEELPALCIKAGSSEKGCCSECGAPWERIPTRYGLDVSRRQTKLAVKRFEESDLTEEHIKAIRAVGITDTARARETTSGYGRNRPDVQRLADEAKEVLGGYYREFLLMKATHCEWRPTCECDAGEPVPSTVLDPFAGTGTTGVAATMLLRDSIMVEANREYAEIAGARIREKAGMLAQVTID